MHEFINSENFTISHAEVYFNKKNHFERENYRNREFFFYYYTLYRENF